MLVGVHSLEILFPLELRNLRTGLETTKSNTNAESLEDGIEALVKSEMGSLNVEMAKYEHAADSTYEIAKWRLEKDEGVTQTLDSKATALVGQSGACLAIIFGLGGLVLKSDVAFGWSRWPLGFLYTVALLLLMTAAIHAALSVKVSGGWQQLKQSDVFHTELFGPDDKNRRTMFLALALWRLGRVMKHMNDRKAARLEKAQSSFRWGLVALLVMGGLVALRFVLSSDPAPKPGGMP